MLKISNTSPVKIPSAFSSLMVEAGAKYVQVVVVLWTASVDPRPIHC